MSAGDAQGIRAAPGRAPLCPFSLRMDPLAAMLNAELRDHPVYDGFELQWFDDVAHGTGMLAFLSRREDRSVDYYQQKGLRLDPGGYEIGGGLRSWNEVDFAGARLEVTDDGVLADVAFVDVEGRQVEVHVDDRDGRRRRPASLLAPVGAGIRDPRALLLVWMSRFDLVRAVPGRPPSIRIDGQAVSTGQLPGARLHRRHLIKYAAPLCSVELNRDGEMPTTAGGPGEALLVPDGSAVRAITAARDGHEAVVRFDPAFPDLRRQVGAAAHAGTWLMEVDGTVLTGGSWSVTGGGGMAEVALDVVRPWRPRGLPWLMRVVTTVVPVFRRWPPRTPGVRRSRPCRICPPRRDGTARARRTVRATGEPPAAEFRRPREDLVRSPPAEGPRPGGAGRDGLRVGGGRR